MPVQRCKVKGKLGWKWGQSGKCYVGPAAKQKAAKQGYAVKQTGWTENVQRKRPAPNPLRADPTRTATLRRMFETELSRRFNRIKRKITALVDAEDAFGLRERKPFVVQYNPSQPRDARGRWGSGGGGGGGGAALSVDSLRSELSSDPNTGRLGTKEYGPAEVEAFRVGSVTDTDRGIFFSGDLEGTKAYRALHEGEEIKSYTISLDNALLAGHQNDVCQKFFHKSYADTLDPLIHRHKSGPAGMKAFDKKIKSAAKKRGFDGIIYLKPAPPANSEVHVFSSKSLTANEQRIFVVHTRWQFRSTSTQVQLFQVWLQAQIQADLLLGKKKEEDAYWQAYVEEGYRKGAGRAFDDTHTAQRAAMDEASAEQLAWYQGTKEEFLRASFARPVAVEKVKLLAGRVFTELKGVTQAMATTITRALTDGLAQGQNPREIARRMIAKGIGTKVRGVQSRALTIARTEIIRAHAEGQLDAMERLGVEEVGVVVEWSTAGDARVCRLCQPLEGVVLKIKEARGLIPRHPNCRCAHVPANVGESTRGQTRSKGEIQKSILQSIKAEMPKKTKRTIAQQKKRTRWAGADKRIDKRRPKALV